MIKKTKGIVLRTIKYRESSLICHIYTEDLGLRSYIVSGTKSVKAKSKSAYFHPLSILRLVVYERDGKDINRIKEYELDTVFQKIPFDLIKGSCALFMTEVLRSVLKEKTSNTDVFNYITKQIYDLESADSNKVAMIPINFMIGLSRVLGFSPDDRDYTDGYFLDMREGLFVSSPPIHADFFDADESQAIAALLSLDSDISKIKLNKSMRKTMRTKLMQYFKVHIDNFKDIQSDRILNQVL